MNEKSTPSNDSDWKRRRMIWWLIAMMCVSLLEVGTAVAESYDHADLSYYLDESGQKQAVQTVTDWEYRRAHVLHGFELAAGPLPKVDHDLPLAVREHGVRQEAEIIEKKISFAVEPGSRLFALLLYSAESPSDKSQRPAVLCLHPTGAPGKEIIAGPHARPNRGYGNELAKRGYVVLCPDYPSFGDLKRYDFSSDRYESGTMKGIVNHIRCVDLLQNLPFVDGKRIGVIGHSLGGHNAIFVALYEPRLRVVVTSCGWTPFHDYYGGKIEGWTSDRYMPLLKTKYSLDPDRVPFDFYELIAALAPRPFFSASPLHDSNFDVAGVRKAEPKIRKVYSLYDAADDFRIVTPNCDHDFPPPVRRKAYQFIDRALRHVPVEPADSAPRTGKSTICDPPANGTTN